MPFKYEIAELRGEKIRYSDPSKIQKFTIQRQIISAFKVFKQTACEYLDLEGPKGEWGDIVTD